LSRFFIQGYDAANLGKVGKLFDNLLAYFWDSYGKLFLKLTNLPMNNEESALFGQKLSVQKK